MRSLFVVCLIGLLVGCAHPTTVQSVQRDTAVTGTRLLNAVIPIQQGIYEATSAKLITPQQGIDFLEVTKQIGTEGQKVATALDKVNLALQAVPVDKVTVTNLVNEVNQGLAAMQLLFPKLFQPGVPQKVTEAAQALQTLAGTIRTQIAAARGGA